MGTEPIHDRFRLAAIDFFALESANLQAVFPVLVKIETTSTPISLNRSAFMRKER